MSKVFRVSRTSFIQYWNRPTCGRLVMNRLCWFFPWHFPISRRENFDPLPMTSASVTAVPEGMFSPSFDPGVSCVTTGMLASPGGVDCERNRGGALFVVMLAVA